jgi:hypothetical protein
LNWIFWKFTGWPIVYCVGQRVITPLAPLVHLINYALGAYMLIELANRGMAAGVRVGCILFGAALLPDLLKSIYGLGGC